MDNEYYKLDVGSLPDNLYHNNVPVSKWLETTTTAGKDGFPSNSLNKEIAITWDVEIERIIGISLYMIGNVLPFLLPPLLLLSLFFSTAQYLLQFVIVYVTVLFVVEHYYFKPRFLKQYKLRGELTNDIKDNQYVYTERNITKYLSINFVWPKSVHRPNLESKPVIFCAVPHGAAPFGITAYPLWSKVWNDKVCHWTCAPIVLNLPIVAYYMKAMGYIPAKSKDILSTLTKKEENIGVILDGIAGMFQPSGTQETIYIQQRKGIVKIALRAGTPIIPVYGFGHTSLYSIIVDPFGILEYLSNTLQTSLTPFFGRWGWFLGPPRRIPVAVVLGEPILCPQISDPTNADIEKYHQQMLQHFEQLFDQHKAAYGWAHKKLKFV